jgi:hypothetical protein
VAIQAKRNRPVNPPDSWRPDAALTRGWSSTSAIQPATGSSAPTPRAADAPYRQSPATAEGSAAPANPTAFPHPAGWSITETVLVLGCRARLTPRPQAVPAHRRGQGLIRTGAAQADDIVKQRRQPQARIIGQASPSPAPSTRSLSPTRSPQRCASCGRCSNRLRATRVPHPRPQRQRHPRRHRRQPRTPLL